MARTPGWGEGVDLAGRQSLEAAAEDIEALKLEKERLPVRLVGRLYLTTAPSRRANGPRSNDGLADVPLMRRARARSDCKSRSAVSVAAS